MLHYTILNCISGTLNARPQRLEVGYSNVEILENIWPYRTIFLCRNEAIPIQCWAYPTSTAVTVDARLQQNIAAVRRWHSLTPWKDLETDHLFPVHHEIILWRHLQRFPFFICLPSLLDTWSYLPWAIHCVHTRKNWDISNSSLSLQNTLPHTSESCAFTLTTVASQFLYLCGFLFSVLWHLKPKADFNLELDFTKFSIFDGSLVRPLKPQRCISGKGALWMGRQCWEQCWLICMAHSESELSLSMEIRKHSVNQDTTYWMREEGAPLGHHREYGWNLTWCQIPYNTNWGAHQLAVYVNSSLT